MARPTKLTPEIASKIIDSVRKGHPFAVAARAAGVAPFTIRRWMRAANGPDADDELCAFCAALKGAQAESEASLVDIITKAATDKWQAAAWLLERRFPQRWAQKIQQQEPKNERVDPLEVAEKAAEIARARRAASKPVR